LLSIITVEMQIHYQMAFNMGLTRLL